MQYYRYAKNFKKSLLYSLLGALSFFLYSKFWSFQHIYMFLLSAGALYSLIFLAKSIFIEKETLKTSIKRIKKPLGNIMIFYSISKRFLPNEPGILFTLSWGYILPAYAYDQCGCPK